MVLKRLKLHQSFDGVARKFSYNQECKYTPSGNTVQQHQCGKRSRRKWPDWARCVLPNIYEILPNYKYYITNNIAKILQIFFIERFSLTMVPTPIVLHRII